MILSPFFVYLFRYIIHQLKERNVKEHSFSEIIFHSNRLLESLDYLQKENLSRKLVAAKSEDAPESSHDSTSKAEELSMLVKCCSLQKDLAECHKKISDYAQQIIDFRNQMDEKEKLIEHQKLELQLSQSSVNKYQELCQTHRQQIDALKTALQNKIDECDTLNITYSSLESKKNDLEIENKMLRNELLVYKNKEFIPISNENVRKTADTKVDVKLKRRSTPDLTKELQETTHTKKIEKITAEPPDTVIPVKIKCEFAAHDSEVNCVCWVPLSTQLITAGADRKVKLWNMVENSMELKKYVRDCNSAIMSVDLDVEAGLLLCASCDFASRVWTVNDFNVRHTLTGHSGKVMSAKFLRVENQIVSGSLDQTLKLWDLRRRDCVQTCSTGSNVNDVVSKNGYVAISCHSNGHINFWDIRSNSSSAHISCSAGITSLDISKSGHLLLASQLDNKLAVIDLRKYKEICSLVGNGFQIGYDWTRAKLSPNNEYCCCGSRNGSIFIWDMQSGNVKKELRAHAAPVIACSWSSCSSYLVSCDSKRKCIIWSSK